MSVEEELARTSAEVARLPRPALDALVPALAQAHRETAIALRAWLARTDGERRYTAQVHRSVLAGLEHAFAAIAHLDPVLSGALERAGAAGGHLAGHHLVSEIARFSAHFEGAPRHLPLNVTRIVATGERELVPRFRTSAARYAGDVSADVRRELAVGILRRESVSALVDRLARIGGPVGPVALQGVRGEPGAVVEHIAEGLFRRYRHWGERLVRTEVQRAYNVQVSEGLLEAQKHLPDLQRRWDASLDARVCPLCAGLHGTVANLKEPFPGGYTEAPAHPNCRCRVGAWRAAWSAYLGAPRGPVPPVATPPVLQPPRRPTLPPPRPHRATLPPPKPPAPVPAPVPAPSTAGPAAPPPFKTVALAQQWAAATYPTVVWDLKGCHVDVLNELLPEFHRLATEWPEVLGRLRFFGTYRSVKAARSGFRWSPKVYAHASQDGARIGLNPAWFGDPAKFRAALASDAASGWHPPGTASPASVLTHEWGHQVDNLLRTWSDRSFLPGRRADGLGLVAPTLGLFRRYNRADAKLSRYAMKNDAEAFAEAFASLRYTPPHQRAEFANRLERLLLLARNATPMGAGLPDWRMLPEAERDRHDIEHLQRSLGIP